MTENQDNIPVQICKINPIWFKLLLGIIHGLIGLFVGVFFYIHGCQSGIKWLETLIPFASALICFGLVFIKKLKYWLIVLITIAVLVLAVFFSGIYLDIAHTKYKCVKGEYPELNIENDNGKPIEKELEQPSE